jgi:hypothetical protein
MMAHAEPFPLFGMRALFGMRSRRASIRYCAETEHNLRILRFRIVAGLR